MYLDMEEWSEIRRRVLVEGVSRRQILRETGMHWLTLKKILEHSEPPGYRQQRPQRKKKLGPYEERIEQILKEDQAVPRKQRHTAKRIWERLREEGFTGGYTVVKEAVRTRITYDNTKVAVSQILGGGQERRLTRGFLQLKSHYLFGHHFCRVARGNEKGVVEGLVKFTRLNFFVPVPQVRDLEHLNDHLRHGCLEDQQRRLRGQSGTKAQLLEEDRKAFRALPVTRLESCRKVSTTASSLSLVRFDGNDHSVPVRWAHHPIVAKGYCQEVVLCADGNEVARPARIWEDEQVRFEPLHYLALLETKPGALDHARPLAGWTLPECFALLRRRLETERDGEGTRQYIQGLRLLEKHPLPQLRRAVEQALSVGAITRDAIAQFLHPREDWRATIFSLDGHPHLREVRGAAPDLTAYRQLVRGAA